VKNRVRELREARGWSQVELGERLEVSRQTVIAIEKEKYDPSLPLAFDIARVFRCRIEDVFLPN
jgi:putative transcriptional regulator